MSEFAYMDTIREVLERPRMLPIGLWVVQRELEVPFLASDIAKATDVSPPQVGRELLVLRLHEMVGSYEGEPLENPRFRRGTAHPLVRIEHPVWELYDHIIKTNRMLSE